MPMQSKGTSVTRTLRLDEDRDSVLKSEAERLGMSINALVNKVLLRYKDVLRYEVPGNWITLSGETFKSIIDQLSNEQIEDITYELGGDKKSVENILKRGMEINHKNILWFIQQGLGEYSGGFRCDLYQKKDMDIMHLTHNFGRKWSHFLVNYITSILQGELGLKVQSVVLENDVHLTITK